jgi:hypothetical protein
MTSVDCSAVTGKTPVTAPSVGSRKPGVGEKSTTLPDVFARSTPDFRLPRRIAAPLTLLT